MKIISIILKQSMYIWVAISHCILSDYNFTEMKHGVIVVTVFMLLFVAYDMSIDLSKEYRMKEE
jgi:hypothetical protein